LNLQQRLHNHLTQIVRDRDPFLATAGHFFVQQYIHAELSQWGKVNIHEFQVRGQTFQNLILNLPCLKKGSKKEPPPILIGAHYDTVPGTPGADDNATGVSVLLELAKAFATQPAKYPIQLVAFDLEEYGFTGKDGIAVGSGASAYADLLRQQQQPLRLMISLEMLGYCDSTSGSQRYPSPLERFYPNRGDFIALIGNLPVIPDLINLSRNMRQVGVPSEWLPVPNRGKIVPQTRLSDHAPFWDRGYRAMMVTDTAMLRNPHYHKPSDRIETLNLDFLTGVCRGLIQGIRQLK
jgi:Zn-dependent M28 family amino/carboxypeptidase